MRRKSEKNKPLCIEVFRGSLIESRHLIDACVCDAEGGLVLAFRNFEEKIFPRSAIKPFQTIPLIKNFRGVSVFGYVFFNLKGIFSKKENISYNCFHFIII